MLRDLILELKSAKRVIKAHEVQLVDYLVVRGNSIGLVLTENE